MSSYGSVSALTEEILARKNSQGNEVNGKCTEGAGLNVNSSSSGGLEVISRSSFGSHLDGVEEPETIVWKKPSLLVSELLDMLDMLSIDVVGDSVSSEKEYLKQRSSLSSSPLPISNLYILQAAEEDGSIMEDLPVLSNSADARSIGVDDFVVLDASTLAPKLLLRLEEIDSDSEVGSCYNYENESNASSESNTGSVKSAPLVIDAGNSLSSIGSLLSYKNGNMKCVETLSTSQASTSPPRSGSYAHGLGCEEASGGGGSRLPSNSSGSVMRQRDRKSSFHSVFSQTSSYRANAMRSSFMLAIKTRDPVVIESANENPNLWRVYKKISIELTADGEGNSVTQSKNVHGRARAASVPILPTIPSEDFDEEQPCVENVNVHDRIKYQHERQRQDPRTKHSAIIIDNDDEEDDDDDGDDDDDEEEEEEEGSMYFYDENNEIVVEESSGRNKWNSNVNNVSIDSKASEDSTEFFGEFEIDLG